MNELQLFSLLFLGGVLVDLILFKHSGDYAIWLMRKLKFGWANSPFLKFKGNTPISKFLMNNCGEAPIGTAEAVKIEFTPEQQEYMNKVINTRVAEVKSKTDSFKTEYEQLKQFKTEFEKSQEQKTHEELVKQKKFEEIENNYKKKFSEYEGQINTFKTQLDEKDIAYALTSEVSKNNGFIEESIALLKGMTVKDKDGNIVMRSKDSIGNDTHISLEDGVKKFYEQRPHLLKASFKQGGGTGAGDNGGTSANGQARGALDGDLNYLNAQLVKARGTGDGKTVSEITTKIKAAMRAKGVSI